MNEHGSTEAKRDVLRVLQSKEETREFYNKIARVYDLLAERSEQPMRAAGLQKLHPRQGESLLEIGCGTGHVLADLAWSVGSHGKVYGIDLSDRMVAIAQDLLDKEGVGDRVELSCGDAEQLPYNDHAMDGVIMNFTLELFDTPDSSTGSTSGSSWRCWLPTPRSLFGTVFVARTRKPFWSIRPALILLWAVIGTQLVATLIAVFGCGLMTPIGWSWAALVWGYCLVWFLLADAAKLAAYRVFGKPSRGLLLGARAVRRMHKK